ncbi:MAG: hypothetical protein ACOYMF_05785 [Bacteroidales bacterium]
MTEQTISQPFKRDIIFDSAALAFIGLAPAFAHFASLPIYMIEPMRLMLVLALIHTNRMNAWILAAILPLFSFLVSGHPEPLKMLVITAELLANTGLFLVLMRWGKYPFLAMFLAVGLSKVFCYSLYMLLFPWSFVVAEAQTGFLMIQGAVAILLASYTAFIFMKR